AADLRDANGQGVGRAVLTSTDTGVRITLDMQGLPPGAKAVHIHEVGKCDGPGFASAGGHFNPEKRQHGTDNPQGPHAGDLPNVTVGANGAGHLDTTTARISLAPNLPTSLFDADGSALVVHAGPDDMKTDPAGNSGARIACGVIMAVPAGATRPSY
ncbi:MAG: superoxide dismutase, partial [Candidatus Rokuibacteriota bacterium]